MFCISQVYLPEQRHLCLLFGRPRNYTLQQLVHSRLELQQLEHTSSRIYLSKNRDIILKVPRIRNRLVDNLAKLVGWTPAAREAWGAAELRKHGINTVNVMAQGIPLNPWCDFRSFLYLEYLDNSLSLSAYLRANPVAKDRQRCLRQVAADLRTMAKAGIAYRDFHFGNILRQPDGTLIWIDTEIKKYPWQRHKALAGFLKKKSLMFERFLRHGGLEAEWPEFLQIVSGQRAITNHDQRPPIR